MAASAAGGGGGIETTLQFPLYIYFDYCESPFWGGVECYTDGDFSELVRYLIECVKTFGEQQIASDKIIYKLNQETISKIGEIYIEDYPLSSLYHTEGAKYIDANTDLYACTISTSTIYGAM